MDLRSIGENCLPMNSYRNLNITLNFKSLSGVPWNIYTWTNCLQRANEQQAYNIINTILIDFDRRLCEELSYETIEYTVNTVNCSYHIFTNPGFHVSIILFFLFAI